VNKVKKYLAKMDRAVDYDFYDDNDLRYVRFKSPFNRRPLIGRRPPLGYAVLLCAHACWFVRTRAAINFGELFGNFDGFTPWCLRCVCVQEERGEAHPPPRREQQPGLPAAMVRHLIWSFRFVSTNEDPVILALLLTLPSVLVRDCCSEEAAFGDFDDSDDWEGEV
jgi:hypothetical protein